MEEENAQAVVEAPKEKLWTKKNAFILLSIAYSNFTLGTCYSLPAPFFPKEAERKGASPTIYGLVFGVYQLVNLIMSPTWGKMMPYLVPRFVLIAGMFVAGSCSILFGSLEFSPPGNPYIILCFFVRIVESVGVTAYITTCYGMIPVLFPNHTATVLSTMEMIFGFAAIVGPTVGGALYQIGGYYLPFVVMGGCLILGTVFTSVTFSGKDDLPQEKTGSMIAMIANPTMIIDIVIFGMVALCVGFNDATLEPHLRQFKLSPASLGAIFMIFGAVYALVSPIYGRMIDKGMNPHILGVIGCSICFVSFLIIGPVPFFNFETSLPVVAVALGLLGFGLGAQNISAFIHGMKNIKKRGFPDTVSTYAMYTGVVMAASSIGAFVGPSLGGLMLDHIGYQKGTIVIVAFEGLLFVILCCHLMREYTLSKKPPATVPVTEESVVNVEEDEKTPLLNKSTSVTT